MRAESVSVGQVVESRAGRDRGKCFLVRALLDTDFCLIVDGRTHKLAKPKKKRLKHIVARNVVCETVRDKWLADKKVFDSEIASFLKDFDLKGVQDAQK